MLDSTHRSLLATAALIGAVLLPASAGQAAATLPDFNAATFIPGAPIDNAYFPMTDFGTRRVYVGKQLDGGDPIDERFELRNIGPGPVILGVQTQIQLDREFDDGLLAEETQDFYAQDTAGNVWYFGEDVTNFIYDDEGNLIETNHESAWRAGVNDALPGFIMPVDQTIGFNYFQEFAAEDEALDEGTTFATGLTITTPVGQFTNVLQVLETSQLSPNSRAFKYYAPGIGLILEEEGLDPDFTNPSAAFPLVAIEAVPEPAGWAMMLLGLGTVGIAARRRARSERAMAASLA